MNQPPRPAETWDHAIVRPYSNGKRILYGLLWTFWTTILTIGGFSLLSSGLVLYGLIALALAVLTGRYAWRIWTWQARTLIFFIVF